MNSQKYCYEYPRPAVTTDCVVFSYSGEILNVLLIQRRNEPFKDMWALPGGFMQMDESAEECAQRELLEETGIKTVELEQLYTFTDINRDPRERTISIAYSAIVNGNDHNLSAGDDAANTKWFSTNELPQLAFDHQHIFNLALERLKEEELKK
jgi:8-oxo-dGTP diphosphatase